MLNKKWSLILAILTVGTMVLGACTPETVIEQVEVTRVVEKEVEVTKIVEGEVVVETVIETVVETVIETVEVIVEPEVEEFVTLHANLGTEPPTLDPALATDTTSVDLDENLFVGLTKFDPDTAEVIPNLATDWDVSEDGTVYTFHLRDDIQWVKYDPTTGETEAMRPVTAYDVEYGIKRTTDPNTASDYAYVLYIIKNAEEINGASEELTLDDLGVKALDDTTLEITLEYPAGYFPAIAGMWVCRPMPQESIDEWGDKWIEAGLIWSNGPYVLSEWIHGGSQQMLKNPLWSDADDMKIEVVDFVMIPEASTAFAMYENNELDYTGVPGPDLPRVREDPVLSLEYVQKTEACTYYYGFTNTKAPFDDVLVRTAFSAAIDRQTLIDTVLEAGGQTPATTFAPPGIFGAPEPGTLGLGYDADLATASLEEFGGVDDYDIVLMHNTSEGHARIAAGIQAMWAENLGVSVRTENQEWKVYLQTIKNTTAIEEMPHVWRLGWCADYPDENNWVHEVFNSEAGANRLRRNCADPNCGETTGPSEFDDLTDQAGKEQDPAVRAELYAQAEDLLAREEAAVAFIYHYARNTVVKPWLTRNYGTVGGIDIYNWTIDAEAKKAAGG